MCTNEWLRPASLTHFVWFQRAASPALCSVWSGCCWVCLSPQSRQTARARCLWGARSGWPQCPTSVSSSCCLEKTRWRRINKCKASGGRGGTFKYEWKLFEIADEKKEKRDLSILCYRNKRTIHYIFFIHKCFLYMSANVYFHRYIITVESGGNIFINLISRAKSRFWFACCFLLFSAHGA